MFSVLIIAIQPLILKFYSRHNLFSKMHRAWHAWALTGERSESVRLGGWETKFNKWCNSVHFLLFKFVLKFISVEVKLHNKYTKAATVTNWCIM